MAQPGVGLHRPVADRSRGASREASPTRAKDGSGRRQAAAVQVRPLLLLTFFALLALLALLGHADHLTPCLGRGTCQRSVDQVVNVSLTGTCCRYPVVVPSKSLVRRITAALDALDAADGPMSELEATRHLREAAEALETAQVRAARKAGATWNEIGALYGLTKQGAQQRFRAAHDQAVATAPSHRPARHHQPRAASPE
jgi:hypothetical protein